MNDFTLQFKYDSDELRKEVIKARKRGMNKAAQKIRNATRSLIKSKLPNASKPNPKYDDKMIDGVRVSKYKESTLVGEAVSGVHIMGTRKKGSGTFRLKFFEDGTDNRQTESYYRTNPYSGKKHKVKGHSTGSVSGKGFFKSSVDSKINEAYSTIEQEIIKAIEKANNG